MASSAIRSISSIYNQLEKAMSHIFGKVIQTAYVVPDIEGVLRQLDREPGHRSMVLSRARVSRKFHLPRRTVRPEDIDRSQLFLRLGPR